MGGLKGRETPPYTARAFLDYESANLVRKLKFRKCFLTWKKRKSASFKVLACNSHLMTSNAERHFISPSLL